MKVFLFGSYLYNPQMANDVDIAIDQKNEQEIKNRTIKPTRVFAFDVCDFGLSYCNRKTNRKRNNTSKSN